MHPIDFLIARTQRQLTFLLVALVAVCLFSFLLLPKPIDEGTKSMLSIIITALLALLQQAGSFWLARMRSNGIPPPAPADTPAATDSSAPAVSASGGPS